MDGPRVVGFGKIQGWGPREPGWVGGWVGRGLVLGCLRVEGSGLPDSDGQSWSGGIREDPGLEVRVLGGGVQVFGDGPVSWAS